jgi:hypothetical protein
MHEDIGEHAQEIQKVQHAPGMCMKTQAMMTKCHANYWLLARKSTHCTIFDDNSSGPLLEHAEIMR